MSYKEILAGVAIVLTFIAFYPYIRGILQNKIKAHVFSWVIWGTTTFVVFLAQLEAKGGAGSWVIGVSGSITIFIAVLAFVKRSDVTITRSDWAFFIMAMFSLPLWYFTSDPMWAVVVLTVVDLLGFGPTFRKAFFYPHTESLPFFGLFLVRNLIVVIALERYSVATALFPVAISAACGALMLVVIFRRRVVGHTEMHHAQGV